MRKTLMAAAVIAAPRTLRILEVAKPEPAPEELLVRLEGCGVCASNLEPWEGKPWFTYPMEAGAPGHEGWGIVEKVGTGVTEFVPGDRVGFLSSHAFARYDVAHKEAVLKLPQQLDGWPFPAEPLGCAMNVFERSQIKKGDTVAVVGIGFLGAVVLRLAVTAGARVIAITRRCDGLVIAEQYGAAVCIPMEDHWKIIEEVKRLTNDRLCDIVIEAAGKQWPLDLSAEITAERGRLIIAGYHQDGARQVNMQLWNWRGLDVINAHERDPEIYLRGMKAALEAIIAGRLDPSPLYTHRYSLNEIGEAFETAVDRPAGFLKALVIF
jgi:threonine dehydrogenase-like Zn-dependent dehydrogenase